VVRKYSTPNFLDCIERLAKGLPIHDDSPNSRYIVLSPGDMVYVPQDGEDIGSIDWHNRKAIAERVYIMKSSESSSCYFLPAFVSSLIAKYDAKLKGKGEFGSQNKSEKTMDDLHTIKENLIKLKVDRLGNISPVF